MVAHLPLLFGARGCSASVLQLLPVQFRARLGLDLLPLLLAEQVRATSGECCILQPQRTSMICPARCLVFKDTCSRIRVLHAPHCLGVLAVREELDLLYETDGQLRVIYSSHRMKSSTAMHARIQVASMRLQHAADRLPLGWSAQQPPLVSCCLPDLTSSASGTCFGVLLLAVPGVAAPGRSLFRGVAGGMLVNLGYNSGLTPA